MGKDIRIVEITPGIVASLTARQRACFLCKWILEDVVTNKKLTGYPLDYTGNSEFPVSGKILHLEVEGFISKLDASSPAC